MPPRGRGRGGRGRSASPRGGRDPPVLPPSLAPGQQQHLPSASAAPAAAARAQRASRHAVRHLAGPAGAAAPRGEPRAQGAADRAQPAAGQRALGADDRTQLDALLGVLRGRSDTPAGVRSVAPVSGRARSLSPGRALSPPAARAASARAPSRTPSVFTLGDFPAMVLARQEGAHAGGGAGAHADAAALLAQQTALEVGGAPAAPVAAAAAFADARAPPPGGPDAATVAALRAQVGWLQGLQAAASAAPAPPGAGAARRASEPFSFAAASARAPGFALAHGQPTPPGAVASARAPGFALAPVQPSPPGAVAPAPTGGDAIDRLARQANSGADGAGAAVGSTHAVAASVAALLGQPHLARELEVALHRFRPAQAAEPHAAPLAQAQAQLLALARAQAQLAQAQAQAQSAAAEPRLSFAHAQAHAQAAAVAQAQAQALAQPPPWPHGGQLQPGPGPMPPPPAPLGAAEAPAPYAAADALARARAQAGQQPPPQQMLPYGGQQQAGEYQQPPPQQMSGHMPVPHGGQQQLVESQQGHMPFPYGGQQQQMLGLGGQQQQMLGHMQPVGHLQQLPYGGQRQLVDHRPPPPVHPLNRGPQQADGSWQGAHPGGTFPAARTPPLSQVAADLAIRIAGSDAATTADALLRLKLAVAPELADLASSLASHVASLRFDGAGANGVSLANFTVGVGSADAVTAGVRIGASGEHHLTVVGRAGRREPKTLVELVQALELLSRAVECAHGPTASLGLRALARELLAHGVISRMSPTGIMGVSNIVDMQCRMFSAHCHGVANAQLQGRACPPVPQGLFTLKSELGKYQLWELIQREFSGAPLRSGGPSPQSAAGAARKSPFGIATDGKERCARHKLGQCHQGSACSRSHLPWPASMAALTTAAIRSILGNL